MNNITYNEDAKERLDKFLSRTLAGFTRPQIKQMIISGQVLVNGKTVSAHHFLKKGYVISFVKKTVAVKKEVAKKPAVSKLIEPKVIAETDDYLVINKPVGLLVHPAPGSRNPSLTDWLVKKYPKIKKVGEDPERPGIVHRLDKDVSGLIVIAKNQKMFVCLKSQFQQRQTLKEYLALVYGKIDRDQGVISFPLSRSKITGRISAKPIDSEQGREAITEFLVLKRLVNYTYLKVTIKTGRTHQIRAHLKAYGHPIVGDKLYYNKNNKPAKLNRPFLHSTRLGFSDLKGQRQEFEAKLPAELNNFLKQLT